jgi:hypothetical protein
MLGRSGSHDRENPLGHLALEGTVWLLLALALAYGLSVYRVEWFFPALLLLIGGRYLTFQTLYGMCAYWVGGVALAAAGVALAIVGAPVYVGAFSGAVVEGPWERSYSPFPQSGSKKRSITRRYSGRRTIRPMLIGAPRQNDFACLEPDHRRILHR